MLADQRQNYQALAALGLGGDDGSGDTTDDVKGAS
jgi:hypothetical protein